MTSVTKFCASFTMIQGIFHILYFGWFMLQRYCYIDWLQFNQFTLWIRLLYYHYPSCGTSVNIGGFVESMPAQAMVTITNISRPTRNAELFAYVYSGLGFAWLISSIVALAGLNQNIRGRSGHWCLAPWMSVTLFSLFFDATCAISFADDLRHTRTLTDLVSYVGGTTSGFGGQNVENTSWAAVLMMSTTYRFIIGWMINVYAFIRGIKYIYHRAPNAPAWTRDASTQNVEVAVSRNEEPRPNTISSTQPIFYTETSFNEPAPTSVNFPRSLLSIPQQLDMAMSVQAAGRTEPGTDIVDSAIDGDGSRAGPQPRGSCAENALRGQLPWSYIPSSGGTGQHRMRDQLPPDEELPPVPVPDYTLRPKRGYYSFPYHYRMNTSGYVASLSDPMILMSPEPYVRAPFPYHYRMNTSGYVASLSDPMILMSPEPYVRAPWLDRNLFPSDVLY